MSNRALLGSTLAILLITSAWAPAAEPAATGAGAVPVEEDLPAWLAPLSADADAHLAAAAEIGSVAPGSAAAAAGIAVADRVLAMAGRRVHDEAEMRVLRSALPPGHDQEAWTVARNGALVTVTLVGLRSAGNSGVVLRPLADGSDPVELLTRLGFSIAEADAPALRWLRGRTRHALAGWLAAHPEAKTAADLPWLGEWLATYLHVLRGEVVARPVEPIPEPFLAELDRFHRAIAARNAVGEPTSDPADLGCDRWFCALFYPFPTGTGADFGVPKIDQDFADQLRGSYADPGASFRTRRDAAFRHANSGRGADGYLGQIKAALLDPNNHGGWPFRSYLVWESAARAPIVAELRQRFAAHDEGSDLAGCGLVAPLVMDDKVDEAMAVIADLATRSPYLAWRMRGIALSAARSGNHAQAGEALRTYVQTHPLVTYPRYQGIYDYCMGHESTLAEIGDGVDFDPDHGLPHLFRARPELVAAALDIDATVRSEADAALAREVGHLNSIAWMAAARPPFVDRDQAAAFTGMLVALSGGEPSAYVKDTIAACHARAGDFAAALRWQQQAVDGLGQNKSTADFVARLKLYQEQQPCTEIADPLADLLPAAENWPGGIKKAEGTMYNAQRHGAWRLYREDGSLLATGSFNKGVPFGLWRSYHNATVVEEAVMESGKRLGIWRTWHENGQLSCEGGYAVEQGRSVRTSVWTWYDEAGHRRESGCFLHGRREGRWSAWGADGALLGRSRFAQDQPREAWPGSAKPEEPPWPAPKVEAVKPVATGVNDF